MRQAIKSLLEHFWLVSGVRAASRWRHRDASLVLAYHNIVPDGEAPAGDRSLHLPRRAFADQLDALAETHEIVPLADLLAGPASNRRPRAAITFDDAYCGALSTGIAELARRGMPATVFVAPAFVGGRDFWWDVIARPDGGMDAAVREHALESLQGDDARIRRWATARGIALHPAPGHARCGSDEELRAASAVPGITLAAHGWSHRNLARLDAPALRGEMERPLAWLRARHSERVLVPCISYPYGRSTPEAEAAAAAAGYRAGFRVEGGWLRSAARPGFATPRLNVAAGISRAGFELRLAGLLGG